MFVYGVEIASLLIQTVAFVLGLMMFRRVRDMRLGFLAALLGVMMLRQVWVLRQEWMAPSSPSQMWDETFRFGVAVATLLTVIFLVQLIRQWRASEAMYRALVEQSLAGVYLFTEDELVYVNEALAHTVGYRPEELIGKFRPTDLIHPDDQTLSLEMIQKRLHGETDAVRYRLRLRHKDGSVIHCEVYGRRIDYQGRPAILGTLIDITEQTRADQALRASEERYRLLVEHASDGIFVTDRDGNYVDVNTNGCQMLGYTREEILQMNVRDLIPPEDQEARTLHLAELWAGKRLLARHRLKRKDGSLLPTEISARMLPNGQLLGIVRDVSAQLQAEEALRQQASTLSALHEASQTFLTQFDTQAILHSLCRFAVDRLGLRMAWVGLREEGSYTLRPAAVHGFEAGYLQAIRVTWDDSPSGQGPGGAAIRTGEARIVNQVETDPQFRPWRQAALKRGYRSAGAFPLHTGEHVLGILALYSGEPDHFTETRVQALQSLANQAALALQQARLYEQARHYAEELEQRVAERTRQLAESEARYRQLVESPLIGFMQADADGRFVYMNQRMAAMYGVTPEEVVGKMTLMDFIAPELHSWLAERMRWRRAGWLEPDVVETEMVRVDGSRFTALVTPAGYRDADGNFAGFIAAVIDISDRKRLQEELAQTVEEQRRLVNLMAGREVRMVELKETIRQLRQQLLDAGLTPQTDDPLRGDGVTE